MDEPTELLEVEPHRYLSAPWRMRYLTRSNEQSGCVFCAKLASDDDIDNLVLWRGESTALIMNLFPYSTGHVMVLPYEHLASPELLEDPSVMIEIAENIPSTMRALRRVLRCQGFNIGMNTGTAAGAGIADHLHMHIVPRWNGDANFMPIVGKVTVMPEPLSVTYAKIRAELVVEHDPSWPPGALVFSADRSSVFLLEDDGGSLPSSFSDEDRSISAIMAVELAEYGLEASIAGFAGDEMIVWIAAPDADPIEGAWVPIDELPAVIVPFASEALQRLEQVTD